MKQVIVLVGVPVVVLTALALFLLGRNGDASSGGSATPGVAAVSSDCKLAILDWGDAADDQYSDVVFAARDHSVDAVRTAANRVSTYCSPALAARVAGVNYKLALAEAQIGTSAAANSARQAAIEDAITAVRTSVS